jgi:hypothetical protein
MIEIGRCTRPIAPVSECKCTLCSLNSIEDEVHFLIVCPFYSQPRSQLFSFLNCRYSTFKFLSSHEKFIYVLGSRNPAIINQTSQYISKATQLRLAYLSPPIWFCCRFLFVFFACHCTCPLCVYSWCFLPCFPCLPLCPLCVYSYMMFHTMCSCFAMIR